MKKLNFSNKSPKYYPFSFYTHTAHAHTHTHTHRCIRTHTELGIMDVDEKTPHVPFFGCTHLTLMSTSLQEKISCLDNKEKISPFQPSFKINLDAIGRLRKNQSNINSPTEATYSIP